MGTNFYFFTQNREARKTFFPEEGTIVDTPDFGYEFHIAKTSAGWLPLFQSYSNVKSVKDIKRVWDSGLFKIYDEYGKEYNWEQFHDRVITFNGGVKGVVKQEKKDLNIPKFSNTDKPQYEMVPISHPDYHNGEYAKYFTRDDEGYEFMEGDFA